MGKLLEVFKDIEVTVKGGSRFGRYKALYRVLPKPNPKKITVKDLKAYAESLTKNHPPQKWFVKRVEREGLTLYVLDQLTYVKEPVEELKPKLEALENEIIALSQEIEDLEEQSKPIKEDLERCKAEIQKIERRHWLVRWIFKFKAKKLKEKAQKLEDSLKPKTEKLTSLKAKLADLQSKRETLKNQIEANGVREVKGRVPIFFELGEDGAVKRVLVDSDDYSREPKLSNYILMRCLGSLGFTTVKYERILGRAEGE